MADFSGVQALTFDCYGTLIDWDGGILSALGELRSLAGCDLERLVHDRELAEYVFLAGPFRLYREILSESLRQAAAKQGWEPSEEDLEIFAASMGHWPPFPDSRDALRRLAERYSLGILSNVETRTLRMSVEQLGVTFDALITAEQVRSYKPAAQHFEEGLTRLGVKREHVLHVAGSLYHDIRPAKNLGWRAIWINRRDEVLPADLRAEEVFPDLASLVDALGV